MLGHKSFSHSYWQNISSVRHTTQNSCPSSWHKCAGVKPLICFLYEHIVQFTNKMWHFICFPFFSKSYNTSYSFVRNNLNACFIKRQRLNCTAWFVFWKAVEMFLLWKQRWWVFLMRAAPHNCHPLVTECNESRICGNNFSQCGMERERQ